MHDQCLSFFAVGIPVRGRDLDSHRLGVDSDQTHEGKPRSNSRVLEALWCALGQDQISQTRRRTVNSPSLMQLLVTSQNDGQCNVEDVHSS